MTLQELATKVRKEFTQDTRTATGTFWKRDSNAGDWIYDMCHDVHAGMFPDDYKYEFIVEALDLLADYGDPDDILNDLQPDVCNHELIDWLGSHGERQGYCDEIMQEGTNYQTIMDVIMAGQLREKEEVLGLVRQALEDRLEEG